MSSSFKWTNCEIWQPQGRNVIKTAFYFRKLWRTPSSVHQKGIIKRDKFRTKIVGLTLLAFLWLYDWSISPFICSFALSIFLSHIRIFSSVELNLRLKTLNYWTAYSPRMLTYIYRRTISIHLLTSVHLSERGVSKKPDAETSGVNKLKMS